MRALVILNTRPTTQALSLTTALCATGAQVMELPCIEIQLLKKTENIKATLSHVNRYHYIIFISRHAVEGIAPYWQTTSAKLIAVGPTTQHALYKLNAEAIVPLEFSSTGILDMPAMQHIGENNILIVCSNQINQNLYDNLTLRGANVDVLTTYTTLSPKIDVSLSLNQAQQKKVNLIISTSKASLDQLVDWFKPLDAHWLFGLPLLVISDKLRVHAEHHGWPPRLIIQSPNATTSAIVDTIKNCYPNI